MKGRTAGDSGDDGGPCNEQSKLRKVTNLFRGDKWRNKVALPWIDSCGYLRGLGPMNLEIEDPVVPLGWWLWWGIKSIGKGTEIYFRPWRLLEQSRSRGPLGGLLTR